MLTIGIPLVHAMIAGGMQKLLPALTKKSNPVKSSLAESMNAFAAEVQKCGWESLDLEALSKTQLSQVYLASSRSKCLLRVRERTRTLLNKALQPTRMRSQCATTSCEDQ